MRRLQTWLGVIAVALALSISGCGTADEETPLADTGRPGEVRVTCSNRLDIPIAALDSEPLAPDSPLAKAASRASTHADGVDYGGEFPTDGWRLAREDEKRAVVVFGDGPEIVALVLANSGNDFAFASDHYCSAQTELGSRAPARWELAADPPVRPNSTSFVALVTEQNCTSGASSEGRIDRPRISYTPDAVIITFSVEPRPEGFHTCQGNQPTPYTVELPEPVGDRELKDGLTYPPRKVEVSTYGRTTTTP